MLKLKLILTPLVVLVLFFISSGTAKAATRTWDGGGGADTNWSTCANWSGPDICPIAGDIATFDATSTNNSTIDAGFGGSISVLNIASGYTGTITQNRTLTLTNSGGTAFGLAGAGTFDGTGQILDVQGGFSLTAGIFKAPATLTIGFNFTISGSPTFTHNSGTVTFNSTIGGTFSCNNVTFNLVTFSHSSQRKTVGSNCNLPLGSGPTIPFGVTINGTLSGSGTLTLTSTSDFTMSATGVLSGFNALSSTQSLSISGATLDLSTYSSVVVTTSAVNVSSGTLTLSSTANSLTAINVSGGLLTQSAGTFSASGTVSLSNGTLTLANGADVNATLAISGGTFNAPSGTMTLDGALTVTNSPIFNANGGTFTFDGSGANALSCNNITFNLVTFAHASSRKTVGSNCSLPLGANPTVPFGLVLNGTLSGTGTLNLTSGSALTLNSGSSLSGFTGYTSTQQLVVSGATADFSSYTTFRTNGTSGNGDINLSSGTLTLPNGADLNDTVTTGALTISGGTFNAPSGTMSLAGGLSISGTPIFNTNGGTITFDGSTATLSCNNVTFNLVTFNSSNTTTKTVNSNCNLPLGSNPTAIGNISLSGTLSGNGGLTVSNAFTVNTGATLSGFNGLTIGTTFTVSGATMNLSSYNSFTGNGNVVVSSGSLSLPPVSDFNLALTINGGTLTASSNIMTLGFNFTLSSGTFLANGGTVALDGIGNQTLSGAITFYNLTKTMRPSILTFPSSTTTTVTNNLNLQGSGTNRLSLRSSSSGTPFRIDAQGGRVLNSLDVKDSNNINSNIMVADSNSIDSGNNTNWSFGVAPSISFYLDAPSGHITNTNPTYRWKKATPSTNSSITKYELYVQPKDMNTNASIGTPLYIDNIQPSVSNNNGYASYPTYSLHDDGDFLNLTANNYILSPNKYNYRVVAHDSAGNIREESLDFYLDPTTSQTGSSTPTTTLQTNPIPSPSSEPTNTEPTTEIPETTSLLETVNSNISNLNLPSLSVFLSFLTKTGNNIKPVFPLVLLGLLPLLGIITLLTNLGGTPFSWNIISKILQAFGLLPKENASGVVYDTKTGNIVPFAVLTLISSEGDENKIVATLITDSKGVYHGVNLAPGVYSMVVKHHEYEFPTKEARPALVTVKDFYKGEAFSVSSQEEKQFLIVPMDGRGKSMGFSKRLLLIFSGISKLLFIPMLVFSTLVVAANPTPFNIFIASIYTLIFWYKVLHLFSFATLKGKVTDESGTPIPNVIITLTDSNQTVVEVTRTNNDGKYKLYSHKDTYQMYISKDGYVASNEVQTINTKEEKKFDTRLKAFG